MPSVPTVAGAPERGKPRRGALWAAFAAVLALLALGAARAVLGSLAALNLPAPVLDPAAVGTSEAAVTPPRRVLLIVADGLRADVAAELPAIQAIGARGARAILGMDPPTFSSAQYVAILTGVPPALSGVRTNARPRPVGLDSVVDRVRAADRRVVQVGDDVDWWGRLFRLDEARLVSPEALEAKARRAMTAGDLVIVHPVAVDRAGHAGLGEAAYRAVAHEVDGLVGRLAAAWDGPVMVLADHGHRRGGGHGGSEPEVTRSWLVAAGPGVRAGGIAEGRGIDVAPTLAALAGVPAPAQALGVTLVDLLDVDAGQAEALRRADARRVADATRAAAAGRATLARAERLARYARGVALVLALVLAARALRRAGRAAATGVVLGLAGAGVAVAGWTLIVGSVSFSALPTAKIVAVAAAAFGALGAIAAFAWPLARAARGRLGPDEACALAFVIVLGASPPAAAAFVCAGAFSTRLTCTPDWIAAGPLVAYAMLVPVAAMGAALPVVAYLAARLRD